MVRIRNADEAATLAGVLPRRVRYACTPSGRATTKGSVGRAMKYRFRWATDAEVAAGKGTGAA